MRKVAYLTIILLVVAVTQSLASQNERSAVAFGTPFFYLPFTESQGFNVSGGLFLGDELKGYSALGRYTYNTNIALGLEAGFVDPDEGDSGTKLGLAATYRIYTLNQWRAYVMLNTMGVFFDYANAYGLGAYGLCSYSLQRDTVARSCLPFFLWDECTFWCAAGAMYEFYDYEDWDSETEFDVGFGGGIRLLKQMFFLGIGVGFFDESYVQATAGIRVPLGR